MKFFFDNCMPPVLARAINELLPVMGDRTCEAHHLTKLFSADTQDVQWLSELRKDDQWIIISGDDRISRFAPEREAWLQSGHIIFFLVGGWTNVPPVQQCWKLIRVFPDILEESVRTRRPAGFRVHLRTLKIERLRT